MKNATNAESVDNAVDLDAGQSRWPRVAAWVRTGRPSAPENDVDRILAQAHAASPGRLDALEAVLEDTSACCRAPSRADLDALLKLEEMLPRQ